MTAAADVKLSQAQQEALHLLVRDARCKGGLVLAKGTDRNAKTINSRVAKALVQHGLAEHIADNAVLATDAGQDWIDTHDGPSDFDDVSLPAGVDTAGADPAAEPTEPRDSAAPKPAAESIPHAPTPWAVKLAAPGDKTIRAQLPWMDIGDDFVTLVQWRVVEHADRYDDDSLQTAKAIDVWLVPARYADALTGELAALPENGGQTRLPYVHPADDGRALVDRLNREELIARDDKGIREFEDPEMWKASGVEPEWQLTAQGWWVADLPVTRDDDVPVVDELVGF